MQRLVRTYLSCCFHLPSMCLCVLPLFVRARLYMQLTAYDCLLDIGFAVVLISTSDSSRHRLRIILTSAAHILDIGFALTPTTLDTQPTLTLQNSQIRFDIGFALSWHRLRTRLDIGFAFGLTLETQPTLALQNSQIRFDIGFAISWHRLRIRLEIGFASSGNCTEII